MRAISGSRANSGSRVARDEAGRGFIGFLVAVIVVGLVGYSLKQYYQVKHRADELSDFAYEAIKSADRNKWKEEDVRFEVLKKVRELGIPLDPKTLVVTEKAAGWELFLEWDDVVHFPGYVYKPHYQVRHTWTRF